MTVKQLINELLDMPLDLDVQVAYVNESYDYEYQDLFSVVCYEEDNEVGLVGCR